MDRYVLDTSALFVYTEGQKGADIIGDILVSAKKKKREAFLSFISLMEIYYVTWQRKSEDSAKELIVLIKSLPIHIVESSERLTLSAGRIKANHRMSVADALIAATAIEKSAVLIHKDSELDVVAKYTKTLRLP